MSCFKKVLLLLSIVGGINWGIYGIWGFNAVGWLLGGSMSWLSRTVFIIVGAGAADAVSAQRQHRPGHDWL